MNYILNFFQKEEDSIAEEGGFYFTHSDYYSTLGLNFLLINQYSQQDIFDAYEEKLKYNTKPEYLNRLKKAFEVLSDPGQRNAYDNQFSKNKEYEEVERRYPRTNRTGDLVDVKKERNKEYEEAKRIGGLERNFVSHKDLVEHPRTGDLVDVKKERSKKGDEENDIEEEFVKKHQTPWWKIRLERNINPQSGEPRTWWDLQQERNILPIPPPDIKRFYRNTSQFKEKILNEKVTVPRPYNSHDIYAEIEEEAGNSFFKYLYDALFCCTRKIKLWDWLENIWIPNESYTYVT